MNMFEGEHIGVVLLVALVLLCLSPLRYAVWRWEEHKLEQCLRDRV